MRGKAFERPSICNTELYKNLRFYVYVTSFGSSTGEGEQSDWLVSKAQVHQCRMEHKHNKNRG